MLARKASRAIVRATPGLWYCSFPTNASTGTAGEVGDPVHVTASATYNWLPFLGLDVTETTITGSSTMRLEAVPTEYTAGCS